MINPWNKPAIPLNAAQMMPYPMAKPQSPGNPLAMSAPTPVPLGTLRPRTSTFMPGTGINTTHQAHPYVDTTEKKEQSKRNAKAPNQSFSGESLQR